MSVSDPIADMLTRIRNAVMSGQSLTAMPNSKVKVEIAKILKEEGYLESYEVVDGERPGQFILRLKIKYVGERRDRPGRRVYTKKQDIPWVLSGLGIAIISTPKGIMTGQSARQKNLGGELLCKVW